MLSNLRPLFPILGGMVSVLALASLIGWLLGRKKPGPVVDNLNARTRAWWVMCGVFVAGLALGPKGATILFALMSFLALREFVTLSPTGPGDHRSLFWAFFIILPINYWLVGIEWYGLWSIFIPVYGFLWIPIRNALAGDTERYLERTATIQWGLMISVYCVSHAPMLLTLPVAGFEGRNALLLMFMVVVAQASDVLQYIWGKTCGRHKIAPRLSPNKTVEGLVGGILSATLLGTAMWRLTPFTWWVAALLSFVICAMGFFGGLVMSAIKRDRGVKDFGSFIEGHGGMLDRIDSLCFAAPIFYHLVRYNYT